MPKVADIPLMLAEGVTAFLELPMPKVKGANSFP